MEDIIKQIKQELKNKKITHKEFAKMCGLSLSGLQKIFSGKIISPKIETTNIMLKALDMNKYEKTPSGTVLTKTEQTIMDMVVNCTEQQQLLIMAYVAGLQDMRNIGSIIIDYNEDKWSKNKK